MNEEGDRAASVAEIPGNIVVGSGVRGDLAIPQIDDGVVDPAHASVAAAVPVVADDIAGC